MFKNQKKKQEFRENCNLATDVSQQRQSGIDISSPVIGLALPSYANHHINQSLVIA
jgi:hypothetical protein